MKHKCVNNMYVTLFSPLPPTVEGPGSGTVGLTAET